MHDDWEMKLARAEAQMRDRLESEGNRQLERIAKERAVYEGVREEALALFPALQKSYAELRQDLAAARSNAAMLRDETYRARNTAGDIFRIDGVLISIRASIDTLASRVLTLEPSGDEAWEEGETSEEGGLADALARLDILEREVCRLKRQS